MSYNCFGAPLDRPVTLIEASAGTGKTYTLSSLIARLLAEDEMLRLREIAVVTFTEAATADLIARVREKLREMVTIFETHSAGGTPAHPDKGLLDWVHAQANPASCLRRIRRALQEYDEASIFTIHGFCQRLLREAAFESGAPLQATLLADDDEIRRRIGIEFWKETVMPNPLLADQVWHNRWTIDKLLSDHKSYRTYPNVSLLQQGDLAMLENLPAKITKCFAAWDDSIAEELSTRAFKVASGISTPEELQATIEQALLAREGENLAQAYPALLRLRASALQSQLKGRLKVNKDFMPPPFSEALDEVLLETDSLHAAVREGFFALQKKRGREIKNRLGVFNFDDLIRRACEAVCDQGGAALRARMRERYRVVMIDEFQDTDALQYDIFRTLYGSEKNRLFLVGDPKQSIYGFRGADIFTYMQAHKQIAQNAPGDISNLPVNYRSDPGMVQAVNALFESAVRPFLFNEIEFCPVASQKETRLHDPDATYKPLHWFVPSEGEQDLGASDLYQLCYEQTVCEIQRLLKAAKIEGDTKPRAVLPGDIAILVRTNAEAGALKNQLARKGIQAVTAQSGNVLQSAEATDLLTLLHAIEQPSQISSIAAALATPLLGWPASAIHSLREESSTCAEFSAYRTADALYNLFTGYNAKVRSSSISSVLMAVLDEFLVWGRLARHSEGERILTNVRHLIELLQIRAASHHLPLQSLINWLEHAQQSSEDVDETELRLESDRNAVQIRTIFKSKGLEYPIVFLPTAFKSPNSQSPYLFHRQTVDDATALPEGELFLSFEAGDYGDAVKMESLAQDLRLLYVALTRAKHRTYLFYAPPRSGCPDLSSLAYLLHAGNQDAPALALCESLKGDATDAWGAAQTFVDSAQALCSLTAFDRDSIASLAVEREVEAVSAMVPRVFERSPLMAWRTTSFSALTQAGDESHKSSEKGELPESPALMLGRSKRLRLRANEMGTLVHSLFELSGLRPLPDESLVVSVLERNQISPNLIEKPDTAPNYDGPPIRTVIFNLLKDVLCATLPGQSFALQDIDGDSHFSELEFLFPLAGISDFNHRLAEALRVGRAETGVGKMILQYAKELRVYPRLDAGMMKGLVDLIFLHEGRWYILDWKTNYLGPQYADYTEEKIADNMRSHKYILQYHLYLLALHRFLRVRLEGYSYESSIGGVYYAYVRGIGAQPGQGWYFDKPPLACIEALDQLFGAGGQV